MRSNLRKHSAITTSYSVNHFQMEITGKFIKLTAINLQSNLLVGLLNLKAIERFRT